MKFLLDTCVVSEFTKITPNPKVIEWLRHCDQSALYLSSITVGELSKGIAKLDEGKRKLELSKWLNDDLRVRFSDRIISLDVDVMMGWGIICGSLERLGISTPVMDSLIAASAIAYDLILVTNNVNDFKNMNVRLHNPWN